ncbi:uncharacterized protein LOC121580014 [Coregonus clupeaformis]|uniref:uncharacterized protein LOC121580014 n=1 Tax=Coregonus clupeaformis TaxID=59861 RepID=UPI001BDFEDEC|nr:uncharacterized protein LOC121580014 [Coregonus clupeaformis]
MTVLLQPALLTNSHSSQTEASMELTILLTAFMGCIGVLRSEATADSIEMLCPRILQPHRSKIRAGLGEQLVIECKADPGLPDDFTLVYWLVNRIFPEVAYTDGRVSETEESASEDGRVIQRSLVFKNVTAEDFRSTFTCVIRSLAGLDQRTVTLMPNHKASFPSLPQVLSPRPSLTPNSKHLGKPRKELKKKHRKKDQRKKRNHACKK